MTKAGMHALKPGFPSFYPPRLTGKDSALGKDRRQKEKGAAEDEMVR